jgi:hypothetical protein
LAKRPFPIVDGGVGWSFQGSISHWVNWSNFGVWFLGVSSETNFSISGKR